MSQRPDTAAPTVTPAAEVDVDEALVRRLIKEQHPDLAALPLAPAGSGWDNAMFRLGSDLAVRLPRRAMAANLVEHEHHWLPLLAPRLPIAVPAPLRTGRPGGGYPWRWSVLPWLPGEPADVSPPAPHQAVPLAGFLRALHVAAPPDAPVNPYRGVPLAKRDELVRARLQRLASLLTPNAIAVWESALSAPAAVNTCWVHGDLHARNVLVDEGAISGVIDWGDLCAGDPATDLAAVWMLLDDAHARRQAIRHYGAVEDGTWLRAAGWAVSFGTVLLETGLADHPRHARLGHVILRRVDEGPGPGELH